MYKSVFDTIKLVNRDPYSDILLPKTKEQINDKKSKSKDTISKT